MADVVIPWGKSKGTPLPQAEEKDLKWCLDYAKKSVENPEKERWKSQNEALVEAIAKELERRAAGGQQQPKPAPAPTPSVAMAVRPTDDLVHVEGAYADPADATAALRAAKARFHLVSPSSVCGSMPLGCEMGISVVLVDPIKETYAITGSKDNPKPTDTVGLAKVALEQIASAAGATWLAMTPEGVRTGRQDDHSDPRYVHYLAACQYRAFDGQILVRTGEVEIDLRDGSDQVNEIITKAKARKRNDPNGRGDNGEAQLLEKRKFILRDAETKAKNRATASIGVRRSYQRSELDKGFAVAKVMFTGRTDDKVARRMFQEKIAASFLQSSTQLYGAPPPQLPQAIGHAPPPAGYSYEQREMVDADFDEIPDSEPRPQPARTKPQPPTAEPQATVEPKPAQAPAAPAAPAQPQQAPAEPAKEKLVGLPPDQDRGPDPDRY